LSLQKKPKAKKAKKSKTSSAQQQQRKKKHEALAAKLFARSLVAANWAERAGEAKNVLEHEVASVCGDKSVLNGGSNQAFSDTLRQIAELEVFVFVFVVTVCECVCNLAVRVLFIIFLYISFLLRARMRKHFSRAPQKCLRKRAPFQLQPK